MKHTSKRLQALVLVLAMCVSFLQIPSFALTEGTHGTQFKVSNVTISADGSFVIAKKCNNHSSASEPCIEDKGKIVTKTENGVTVVDTEKSINPDKNTVTLGVKDSKATCIDPATIEYSVAIAGDDTYSTKFTTAPATGKHTFANADVADEKLTAEQLAVKTNYELLEDTATCTAPGKKIYAKICQVCHKTIETEKVPIDSPVSYHNFIKEENDKTKNKVLTEEITAPACNNPGKEYHYIQCKDCGQKLYDNGNKFEETAIKFAKVFDVATLPHTFEYKVALNNGYDFVTKTTKTDTKLFKVDSKCTVCSTEQIPTEDVLAKVTKVELVADKTVEPKFDCVAGSKTYKVTYTATDYSKEKVNNKYQTKDVVEEVTVPYYNNYYHGHDRTDVYVPDEESIVKATCTKDGHYNLVNPCKVCGDKEVYATIKLPATGKHTAAAAKKENVVAATTKKGGSYDLVVRCADCGEIISSTHKTTAKIVVKASKINSVKNYKGKKAKVTVKKAASVTGYQIQYGTKKNFKGAKHVNTRKTSKYLTKLAKNKKYYVRVRTYKTVDGKLYFSSWSGAKTVTIKK